MYSVCDDTYIVCTHIFLICKSKTLKVVADVASETEFCGNFSKSQGKITELWATPVKRVAVAEEVDDGTEVNQDIPAPVQTQSSCGEVTSLRETRARIYRSYTRASAFQIIIHPPSGP